MAAARVLPLEVDVFAPARLHLGFMHLPEGFAGLGVAVAPPGLRLSVRRLQGPPAFRIEGPPKEKERIHRWFRQWQRLYSLQPVGREAAALRGGRESLYCWVQESLPSHAGLGSGTQLALTLGKALSLLYDLEVETERLAEQLGRAARLPIGTWTFEYGGFVLYHPAWGTQRLPFPEDWVFILALPLWEEGLHSNAEGQALSRLGPMAAWRGRELLRQMQGELLPSLERRDIARFGAALTQMQHLIGEHFAPVQGEPFASPLGSRIVGLLRERGAYGVGQSSWGPLVFGLSRRGAEAESLLDAVEEAARGEARFWLAHPDNEGARWRLWWDDGEMDPAAGRGAPGWTSSRFST